MNYYLTFSGARYHEPTKRIVEDAPKFGADKVWVTDDVWLRKCRPGFCDRLGWFFDRANRNEGGPRGVCWFCWKPFVVLDAFRRLAPGDVLLFTDADTYPIATLSPLYERCRADGGVMLFNALGWGQGEWTKRDVFVAMGCDEPRYHNAQHAVARFMLFEKGGAFPAERFLGEWLGFTANPIINTFEPSVLGLPDLPGFKENRCEQSVLTNLAVKYGVRLYREACQFGAGGAEDLDIYPQTFVQAGAHSFDPDGHRDGSAFRNVNE